MVIKKAGHKSDADGVWAKIREIAAKDSIGSMENGA